MNFDSFNPLDLFPDYDPQHHIIIPLTQGQYTIVDSVDADLVSIGWFANKTTNADYYYATKTISLRRTLRLHRVILGRVLEKELARWELCDHKNRNTLDNRRRNLRLSNMQQNQANKPRNADNTSGYKGVFYHKLRGKWMAQIVAGGKQQYLGIYSTPELAYLAYCKAALELHGEFAPQEVRDFLAVHHV